MPLPYIIYDHYKSSPRALTIVKSREKAYPFYRSTGQNSNMEGTWLPFMGIGTDGWLVKPNAYQAGSLLPKSVN